MKKLIIGATGSIGSSLAKQIVAEGGQVHLVGRDKAGLADLASELNSTFTKCLASRMHVSFRFSIILVGLP